MIEIGCSIYFPNNERKLNKPFFGQSKGLFQVPSRLQNAYLRLKVFSFLDNDCPNVELDLQ